MPPDVDIANDSKSGKGDTDFHRGNLPTETTPLLLFPSAHSTGRSSWENLAALEARSPPSRDVELEGGDYDRKASGLKYWSAQRILSKDDYESSPGQEKRKRQAMINNILIFCFLVISVSTLFILWKEGVFMQKEMRATDDDYLACQAPLSSNHPVKDMGLLDYHRPKGSRPPAVLDNYVQNHKSKAIPTNAWYQNFLLLQDNQEPTQDNRAYTIPYIVDAAGPIPGIRIHTNHISSTQNVMQLNVNDMHGITMGVIHPTLGLSMKSSNIFSIHEMTQLAVSLKWDNYGMTSPIVKGMPYTTIHYASLELMSPHGFVVPAIASQVPIYEDVIVDQKNVLKCSSGSENEANDNANTAWVQKELELYVPESDFTWLVFVSEEVQIKCEMHGGTTVLRVMGGRRLEGQVKPFYFRTALFKPCTKGANPVYCHQDQMHPKALHLGQGAYGSMLRQHAHLFPGPKASVSYDMDETENDAKLLFDWDIRAISDPLYPTLANETAKNLIMYALPHHLDMMTKIESPSNDIYCAHSLVGPSCLVEGSSWALNEKIPSISFRAERPPASWSLPFLSESINRDIDYRLPDYFQRGAGDTYFSGKMLAKLGRILLIAEELKELCSASSLQNHDPNATYLSTCQSIQLPKEEKMRAAIDSLKSSVEIWLNGTAETPFVYDSAWGGVVSCGCLFNDKNGSCDNKFPECPAFDNPGLNFGNAYYNDQHFHYGYFIGAAAAAAHFDPEWGRNHFEQMLLLIRNIANPSEDDKYFPMMRHKDVYQGNSWASGIATAPLNGRNQESSSESLAAYESIALYGTVMASNFAGEEGTREEHDAAVEVRRVGKLMTASELRAARKYYHVNRNEEVKLYPDSYQQHVIGIMWQTMAQFQTWFGSAPYLATGIQLLPLTPIAGQRDGIDWAQTMYPSFEESCVADKMCEEQGWSVLQLGALSTVGHRELAFSRARQLPDEVFDSAGGNGHSMTNTIWYIATRAPASNPPPLNDTSTIPQNGNEKKKFPKEALLTDCYRPETCTDYVLDTVVALYTCRQRIAWLIEEMGFSQKDACVKVAAIQFPKECGKCNPLADYAETVKHAKEEAAHQCPPCSQQQCHSDLNRCPVYQTTYVCTNGANKGGCSGFPWPLAPEICTECCDLTHCPKISPLEITTQETDEEKAADDACPDCSKKECLSAHGNLCPATLAPYLCVEGMSKGGCSTRPWSMQQGQCQQCCKVQHDCKD